ncbi:hypothetical protein Cgig2_011193 [Carnegiea gigantea]|uniref:Uncharacterized protein n=1 Tax=Carnegiea gigantea TaxID=171969 RepID=A0A9Q1KG13_9CARY|nr:hypothetical protein Cgig2_011193 [Carnegiea gigantea]
MALLIRNLKFSSTSCFKMSTNTLGFRSLRAFRSPTPLFCSFGSATAESEASNLLAGVRLICRYLGCDPCPIVLISRLEDGVLDRGDFMNWSNGGGLFHKSACIDPTAVVEVGAVIHPRATLAANVHIESGAVVGPCVTVGHSTRLGYNVALSNCSIGDGCAIHNGVCIGQDGFGFFVDELGNMTKKPQMLYARIGNHVEIGANTCIDRGRIGDYVTFGGRVAVRDHVSIVSKVRLAANSCVTKDISVPGDYGGFPAVPIQLWRRQIAAQRLNCKDVKSC